jgi:hypothetical protein
MNCDVEFTCPKCGGHKIEEIQVGITTATLIDELGEGDDGAYFTYGEQTNEDGYVDRYQCGGCGFTIIDHTRDDLTEEGLDIDALIRAVKLLNLKKEVADDK